jgi:hypothetical protein
MKYAVYNIPHGRIESMHETREEAEKAATKYLNPNKIIDLQPLKNS